MIFKENSHNENNLRIKMLENVDACLCIAGNETVDNILVVLLSTSMFMGGVIGFALDNTIPGKLISLWTGL